jgi:hypothetical protein
MYIKIGNAHVKPVPARIPIGTAVLLSIITAALGCTVEPTTAQQIADEGLAIIQHVDVKAAPEAKLHTADELLRHAKKYEQLMSRSTDPQYSWKVEAFQLHERKAVAVLMRLAAEEYVQSRDMAKARTVYNSMLEIFPDTDNEGPIRRSAMSALNTLEMDLAR